MLVDVVLYGGELDLLRVRLDYLQADETIVVEGDRYFTNEWKGFSFRDVQDEFPGVRYWPVTSREYSDPWRNEFHQRSDAHYLLQQLSLPDDAIVGLFDADEIPDRDLIRATPELSAWWMEKFQGSAFWYQQTELTGVSGAWRYLQGANLADVRRARNSLPALRGGFHLSSFGTLEETVSKWNGFSHQELNRPNMAEWVENCWVSGRAIENGIHMTEVDEMPERMPAYIRERRGPEHWYRRRDAS
jgi:hypothetical protein